MLALNISLIGMMSVGKTSLIKKYVNPDKDIQQRNAMTTIGVDQYTKYIKWKGANFKLKIWDTAGQERFQSITTNFLKPIDGVCLVFSFDSLDSLQSTCKWKESIEQVKLGMPYVLLGNKCDLETKEVTSAKIAEKQKEYGCSYFQVSAYTGEGV
jgi:small GTP-binding protein